MPTTLTKAQLIATNPFNKSNIVTLDCLFNPSDYSFSKANSWKSDSLKGNNVPKADFQGGGVMSMKFQLFFDTYDKGTDVRTACTDKLLTMMKIVESDSKKNVGQPPYVEFHWGTTWSFKGVIKSINLKFTLFNPDGTPVRATADLELQQALDEKMYAGQNPTSGGDGARASRLVRPGDTLDLISYQEYGDPTLWRHLAEANRLEDPRALRPGQRLVVPSL
jgi:hypothetical protein